MEQSQLRSLVVARGLLERAGAADETDAGRVSALVLCDLAVETAAKALLQGARPTEWPGTGYSASAADRNGRAFRDPSLGLVLDSLLAIHRTRAGG